MFSKIFSTTAIVSSNIIVTTLPQHKHSSNYLKKEIAKVIPWIDILQYLMFFAFSLSQNCHTVVMRALPTELVKTAHTKSQTFYKS